MREGDFELPEYVRLGEVFQDRYRLETVLGRGAVGVVVGARHLLLDRPVAIKFMMGAASEQPDSIARFVQEARSAARLKSAHVVRVFDVAVLDNGVPYIVMEHLEGTDLAAVLRRSGPVGVRRAAEYMLQACEAIAEAHEAGIVHRDLKPANLFLAEHQGRDPGIKVLDFGIAKSSPTLAPTTLDLEQGEAAVRMTLPRSLMGSPLYMSPEQMESSGDVDPRTDIWALGVTLHELVTGRVPFTGTTIVQVYSKMLAKESVWLKQMPADAPPELRNAIARCLRRDRGERYGGVRELSRALAPLVSQGSLDRTQPSPRPSLAPASSPVRRSGRRRTMAIVGAVTTAVAVTVSLGLAKRPSSPQFQEGTVASAMVPIDPRTSPTRQSEPSLSSRLAAPPPVESLNPIALVPPFATQPEPPLAAVVAPAGAGHGSSARAIPAMRAAPLPPPMPPAVPPDASASLRFDVQEMLRARE